MSDQSQEESVSLHPRNETPQPLAANNPTPPQLTTPQVAPSPAPITEQPQHTPVIQPELTPRQDAPQGVAEERITPFIAEVYDDQRTEEMDTPDSIEWTASEYIAHNKNLSWYLILGSCVVILTVFIFFVTGRDIFSSLCVLIIGIIFGVYAGRKPKEQQYVINENGISIGNKTYSFSILKAFSVVDEGPFSSIIFLPMKRFMPLISIYYDPADEEIIINYLSTIMPMEYRKHDSIERFMHKIKF